MDYSNDPEIERPPVKYFIKKGDEEVEVTEEEYLRYKEKLFRVKLMVSDMMGIPPFTPYDKLPRSKQKRFKEMVMFLFDNLSYDTVVEESSDIVDDIFKMNAKDLPIRSVV